MRVRVRAGEALGDGWERAAGGVLGEFQTRELLADAGGGGSSDGRGGLGRGPLRALAARRGDCRRRAATATR